MAKITAKAEEIARFYGGGKQFRLSSGSWVTCCPVHKDKKPSMSVTDGRKDILFNCYAGCETKDIMNAVRQDMSKTNPTKPEDRYRPVSAKKLLKPVYQWMNEGLDGPEPEIPLEILMKKGVRVTGKWPWHNPSGEIIRWMFRLENANGEKEFMPMSVWWSPKHQKKIWRIADTEIRYPYNIHLDDGKKTIFHIEGEKCVDLTIELFGTEHFHATTIGASNSKCDFSSFENRNVMILCDMDSSGYKVGQRLSRVPGIKLWAITPNDNILPTGEGYDIYDMTDFGRQKFKENMLARLPSLFQRIK